MIRFPFSDEMPVRYGAAPATEVDVAVIGGGVIGVCTALYLARDGHSVALLEKGRIAGEQSSRNWGWIRQQGRDPAELPIMVLANRLWRELAQQTNEDFGLIQGGVTYLAEDAASLAGFADWLPHAAEHDVDSRLMTSAEVAAMFPDLARRYAGALHTASDMRAEPWKAVPALAGIAARAGVHICENCAVRCLDVEAGQVCGVLTEKGAVRSAQVVLAGGAWSSLFLANHGVHLPQLSVRATALSTTPLPVIASGGVADDSFAFRPRADGGYTLAPGAFHELFIGPTALRSLPKFLPQLRADPFGTRFLARAPRGYPDSWTVQRRWTGETQSPFERMRVLNPSPNRRKLTELTRAFASRFPDLPEFDIACAWAGMIDTMPDTVPVVDRIAALPGLTVGTGMSGHGFGIGPGMGRVLASLATGQPTGFDLTRFAYARFARGVPIRIGPSL